MRSPSAIRALLAVIALGVFWRAQPEAFSQLLGGQIVFDVGSPDHPHELRVPVALMIFAPFALRFGLPLIFKAALLLPFAATAATRLSGRRGATFDPARDLPSEPFAPGSQEQIAIDKAIAAALAARNAASPGRPAFAKATSTSGAVASVPASPVGRRDAAA